MKFGAILLAGGSSRRMGGEVPKLFLKLDGRALLDHSLRRLISCQRITEVVVVIHERLIDILSSSRPAREGDYCTAAGGNSRAESVLNGVKALSPDLDGVVVHDGARPLFTSRDLDSLLDAVERTGAATLVAPVNDTIKRADTNDLVVESVPRDDLRRALTPQAFLLPQFRDVLEKELRSGFVGTDCASFMERAGSPVRCVDGEPWNVKLTVPSDLPIIETLYSVHRGELQ